MHIGEIHLVMDLADGQRAYPEPDHAYQLQSQDDPSLDTTVEYVERRGDRLIARGHNGHDYAVSGFDRYELKTIRKWLYR
jgi:predicted alpha/beta hydrolase family esterase